MSAKMNKTQDAMTLALTEQSVLAGCRSTTPRLFNETQETACVSKLPGSVTTTARTNNLTITPHETNDDSNPEIEKHST